MTYPADKQAANDQYAIITNALENGKRFVFDKKDNKFVAYTKSQAKALAKDPNFITNLSALKAKVEDFVATNGIDDQWKIDMEKAFENRAQKLAKRFVLFGSDQRNQAVQELNNFKEVIERASKQAQLTLNPLHPAHTEGSQEQTQNIPPSPSAPPPERSDAVSEQSQNPDDLADDIFGPSKNSPKSQLGELPPPPPPKPQEPQPEVIPQPPPPLGRPPPPPPGAKPLAKPKGPSSAQQLIMKERKFVEGEQKTLPKLPSTVDAGRSETIKSLTSQQKAQLREEIKNYLEGTPVVQTSSAGKILGKKRAKDGLKEKIAMIEKKLAEHANVVKSLAAPTTKLSNLETSLEKMQRRLETWEDYQKRGKPYIMTTTTKDKNTGMISPAKLIIYYPESEMESERIVFNAKPSTDQEIIKKGLASEKGHTRDKEDPIPEQRTLAGLIQQQRTLIEKKQKEITATRDEITKIQNDIKKLETGKSNEVSFSEYIAFVEDRKSLESTYNNILRWIPEDEKAAKEAEQRQPYVQAMSDMSLIHREREMLAELGPQRQMILNPDLTQLLENDEIMTDYEIQEANEKLKKIET